MKEKENEFGNDLDLFDFIDILTNRKLMVLSFLGAAVIFAAIYCFALRPEAPIRYKIQIGIRYPHQGDMVSKDPDNPSQNINIGNKVMGICSNGVLRGDLQKRLELTSVPEINVEQAGNTVPVLMVSINYHEEDKGKRIINEVVTLLKQNQILQGTVKREKQALLSGIRKHMLENEVLEQKISQLKNEMSTIAGLIADNKKMLDRVLENQTAYAIDKQMIDLFERQQLQWNMSRSMLSELLNRLIRENKKNNDAIAEFETKLDNLKKAFKPEGSTYSSLVHREDGLSVQKIFAISSVVGLAMGIFLAFIIEVRKRRLTDP